ncbi:hypothetical protein L798_13744 [Zootermopsis nevadensis]|uniref:Uncharacterized protein n=1 Tax=Zootermopsis nevadensis TaxID=136037 RepID=A0A067QTN5_ZOONE|nr:hypothetical protein L798_13744 [Zootermopsis nevadensis]
MKVQGKVDEVRRFEGLLCFVYFTFDADLINELNGKVNVHSGLQKYEGSDRRLFLSTLPEFSRKDKRKLQRSQPGHFVSNMRLVMVTSNMNASHILGSIFLIRIKFI